MAIQRNACPQCPDPEQEANLQSRRRSDREQRAKERKIQTTICGADATSTDADTGTTTSTTAVTGYWGIYSRRLAVVRIGNDSVTNVIPFP